MSSVQYTSSTITTRFGANGIVLRARNNAFLPADEIRVKVPSVFAETKHASRSDQYSYIPTVVLMEKMGNEGFFPVEVRQGGTKDEERRNFTKHLIKFRQTNITPVVGDTFPEVAVINSHDGTSAYHLPCAWFRWTCTNGMYVPDHKGEGIKASHRGDVSDIIEASFRVVERFTEQREGIEHMAALQLTGPEQTLFAEQAATLRFDEETAIRPSDLLTPRRQADVGNDLWKTFNRVQERMVNGLVATQSRDQQGRPVRRKARAVNNISENVKLNQALWALAEGMHALKQAA